MISLDQIAYVKGSNIIDGLIVVNDIISWTKASNKRLFLFKVDFEMAFDNLNWDFLFNSLDQMGFGKTWTGWVKGVMTSAKVSMLLNGSPTRQFLLEKEVG